ncbi:MAG TPA: branched-chain amino acid ABC transporter permease [Acidimicrobiia bacterium]|nr:branched-chain amino acid ABC transporter permease [Acidimicrobiia bacterium]
MTRQRVEPSVIAVERGPSRRRSRGPLAAVATIVLLLTLLPLARPLIGQPYNYVLQIGMVGLMWIALASSWNIIGGFAGYISLGHNVFYGIGGYASGLLLLYFDWSPLLTWPIAGLLAVICGFLVGLVTLRTRGPAFIISTVALLLMVALLFDNWEFVGASNGLSLPLPPFSIETVKIPFYYAMLLIAVGSVYLSYRVAHSKFGLALRAIAQDETKAEVGGIDTRKMKVTAFSISAFFVGAAGAVWGYSLTYLRPAIFFSIAIAAEMVLMAIIGGRGTVAGPVVGAILLVTLNEISVSQFGSTELNIVVTGVIMLVVLLFFPMGVVGTLRERGKLPSILDWD